MKSARLYAPALLLGEKTNPFEGTEPIRQTSKNTTRQFDLVVDQNADFGTKKRPASKSMAFLGGGHIYKRPKHYVTQRAVQAPEN